MNRVLVAIATYRRPEGLARLLQSLHDGRGDRHFDVLVVDNDAAGSAQLVAETSSARPIYVREPRPGIAAARNRALDEFDDRYDAILFVDDDEFVSPGWVDQLVDCSIREGAGVVTGPVDSLFPDNAPAWVVRGRFLQRPAWADGAILKAGATNNALLAAAAWRGSGAPRFDDAFSKTGGEDARFFADLLSAGVRIVFSARAVVFEPVPADRMRFKWLLRRAYRNGIVSARIWVLKHGRLQTFAKGAIMIGAGLAAMSGHALTGRGLQASSFNTVITGAGVVSALTGVRVHEYKRISS